MSLSTEQPTYDAQIAAILQYRYGDGLVCFPKSQSKDLYVLARKIGYIDGYGYLTHKGRVLLAKYQYI